LFCCFRPHGHCRALYPGMRPLQWGILGVPATVLASYPRPRRSRNRRQGADATLRSSGPASFNGDSPYSLRFRLVPEARGVIGHAQGQQDE
jgi:hypothetical protein